MKARTKRPQFRLFFYSCYFEHVYGLWTCITRKTKHQNDKYPGARCLYAVFYIVYSVDSTPIYMDKVKKIYSFLYAVQIEFKSLRRRYSTLTLKSLLAKLFLRQFKLGNGGRGRAL